MDLAYINSNIDKSSPVPIYHQLKELIMTGILNGTYPYGMMLPSELEICKALDISRPTVRQALNLIVNEGYLTRQKGKGTIVSRPKLEANFTRKLESYHSEMQTKGIIPSTKVIDFRITNGDESVNGVFGLDPGEKLILLERLCLGDNEPIMYQVSYLPCSRFEQILNEDLVSKSLYNVLFERFGVTVQHVHRQIEAVEASHSLAEILDISRGQALCRVSNTAYDQNGQPVEVNVSYYRGDRSKFSMDMYSDSN